MDDFRKQHLIEFVEWSGRNVTGDEKGQAQIFLDRLFLAFGRPGCLDVGGQPEFRIRKSAQDGGGTAFADYVWKPLVLIEMKARGQDLSRHYRQAFDYWTRLAPGRPQYVVLCNFDEFWIYDFDSAQMDAPLDKVALAELPQRYGPLAFLFPTNEKPLFGNNHEEVTRQAADRLAVCFNKLVARNVDRDLAQRFILQMLVALFAEDIGLLPKYLVARLIEDCREPSDSFDLLGGLFAQMNTPARAAGGRFKDVDYFNGGIFADPARVELFPDEVAQLRSAAESDWSKVRPEIFGTLFEHSLQKEERHAFGAHFTSPLDIMKMVGPTIVEPWRDRIESARTVKRLEELRNRMTTFTVLDPACGSGNFLYLAYRELKRLEFRLNERLTEMSARHVPGQAAIGLVTARQFYGIDINPFAIELAKVAMMIARKLAIDELHVSEAPLPLSNLNDNFIIGDALLCRVAGVSPARDEGILPSCVAGVSPASLAVSSSSSSSSSEQQQKQQQQQQQDAAKMAATHAGETPASHADKMSASHEGETPSSQTPWPRADVIIGNPPFLGSRYFAKAHGYEYVRKVHAAYPEVPKMADFCVYWFRRAQDHLPPCTAEDPFAGRAGLVGTQNIRNNQSRVGGLDYIAANGTIVEAVDNQPWSGEANVHVSIVNWVKTKDPELLPKMRKLWTKFEPIAGTKKKRKPGAGPASKEFELVSRECAVINSTLSDVADASGAKILSCNTNPKLCYVGQYPFNEGFLLAPTEAKAFLTDNPRASQVLFPYMIGRDLVADGKPSRWIIDFSRRNMLEASAFEKPFNRVKELVMPTVLAKAQAEKVATGKESTRWTRLAERWWQFRDYQPGTMRAIAGIPRYIVCSRVTKRPVFAFLSREIHPDNALMVFPLADDYSFGILQSSAHWQWFVTKCSKLKSDFRYTPESVFDTFPWPQSPAAGQVDAVAAAGREIRRVRAEALANLKGGLRALYRTLELPGKNPLKDAHAALDAAVMRAYGFAGDKDLLGQLLALNLAVASRIEGAEKGTDTGKSGTDTDSADGIGLSPRFSAVTPPGVPANYGDASRLITEDCIQP